MSDPLREAVTRLSDAVAHLTDALDREPLTAVAEVLDVRSRADVALAAAVRRARAAGSAWPVISDLLGVSAAAARDRFGDIDETAAATPTAPATATGEPVVSLADRAVAIFTLLAQGSFDAATRDFDATMTTQAPADKLAGAWEQAAGTVGTFRHCDEPLVRVTDNRTIVDVPLSFSAGDLLGRVAFDGDSRVAGLFLLPPSASGH